MHAALRFHPTVAYSTERINTRKSDCVLSALVLQSFATQLVEPQSGAGVQVIENW